MDPTLVMAAAVVMIAVGVSFLYMLLGRRPGYRPTDAMEWIGSALSVALIISAGVLLVMSFRQAGTPSAAAPTMLLAPGATRPEIADMALDIEAKDFVFSRVSDGVQMSLDSLRGKVVLANFWGTWCGPCLTEIPELNRLQEKYADQGLVVLSISDEDRQTLIDFQSGFELKTLSTRIPMGQPLPVPFSQAFEIRPSSFVIDRNGRVKRYVLGARSYEIFDRMVTPYL